MFQRRACVRSALLTTVAVAACVAGPAWAQTRTFNVPAQEAGPGVTLFSRQAGVQILAAEAATRGRRTQAVMGGYTLEAGLAQLLAGSGLRVASNNGRTVTLAPVPQDAAATPVAAEPVELNAVQVTGTRIAGAPPVGSQPVVIDRKEILASGRNNASDLLRLLPQVTALGRGEEAQEGVSLGPGNFTFSSGVNLRGLGVDATLTLLNGHRMVSAGEGGIVDVSQVPLLGVERVEVIADGASAIYGSDAVGGVVNFILRRGFDGSETVGRYGAGKGFDQVTLGQSLGKTWTGGGLFAAVEYGGQSRLAASKRDFYSDDLRPVGGPDLRVNGVPGNVVAGGVTYGIPDGATGTLQVSQLLPGVANRQSRWADADVVGKSEKVSAVLTFEHHVTDHLRIFADAIAAHRTFARQGPPSTTTLTVPQSNAFFVSPVPGATTVSVQYNYRALFPSRIEETQQDDFTAHGGIELRLPHGWTSQVSGLASRSRGDYYLDDFVNSTLLAAALADPNPATAFNPFGDAGANGPATVARVRGFGGQYRRTSLQSAGVDASGPIFSLPSGDVRVAVGLESRKERSTGYDFYFQSGLTPAPPTDFRAQRRVDAIYGELRAPLLSPENGIPLAESLTVSAAVRGERFTDLGDTLNPKLGVEWRLTPGLQLIGGWGTSFKAPRLRQTQNATNSIAATNVGLATGPAPVIYLAGTRDDLRPEKAETWHAGFRLTPSFLEGFSAEANVYRVKYRDRILPPSFGEIVSALTTNPNSAILIRANPTVDEVLAYYANPKFSATGQRPPPNTIVAIIDGRTANLGAVTQTGIDANLAYSTELAGGTLKLSSSVTYIFDYTVARVAGEPTVAALNTINNPVSLRARSSVGWRADALSLQLSVNHVGRYRNTTITPVQRISSWTTFDADLGYTFADGGATDGLSISLNARNLLDRDPPSVAHVSAANRYDAEQANGLGRVLSVTVTKSW